MGMKTRIQNCKGLINACEKDLKVTLKEGEIRDLIKDNRPWSTEVINKIVEAIMTERVMATLDLTEANI